MTTNNPDKLAEQLSAYLDGELGDKERAATEELLRMDAGARAEFDRLRETAELVRALPRASAPTSTVYDVMSTIERSELLGLEPPRSARTASPWLGFRSVFLAAATIALTVGVGLWGLSLSVSTKSASQFASVQDGVQSQPRLEAALEELATPPQPKEAKQERRAGAAEAEDRDQRLPAEELASVVGQMQGSRDARRNDEAIDTGRPEPAFGWRAKRSAPRMPAAAGRGRADSEGAGLPTDKKDAPPETLVIASLPLPRPAPPPSAAMKVDHQPMKPTVPAADTSAPESGLDLAITCANEVDLLWCSRRLERFVDERHERGSTVAEQALGALWAGDDDGSDHAMTLPAGAVAERRLRLRASELRQLVAMFDSGPSAPREVAMSAGPNVRAQGWSQTLQLILMVTTSGVPRQPVQRIVHGDAEGALGEKPASNSIVPFRFTENTPRDADQPAFARRSSLPDEQEHDRIITITVRLLAPLLPPKPAGEPGQLAPGETVNPE